MAVRKQRLDKYYNLAKEKGYRARSAFKLLELNRKYNFLVNSHIAVDLCAAPGGWMQILAQEMPTPRRIIGIDLDQIKPLGSDTISFVGDITTIECRKTLVRHLEGHQADIFVHDGAPNFGASKDRDMFVQNDLVLHALKLSTEFLKEGGTFVTKIFRSENFSKITKVLEELFVMVDITKPLSSRNESAEIFAVCRQFKNPEFVNPAFFDSEILFYDDTPDKVENKKILLSDFIKGKSNKVILNCSKVLIDFQCELITGEFVEMFKDLKLLHETDLKKINKLKAKIIKKVKNRELDIPILDDLIEFEESKESEEEKIQTIEEKINEIDRKLHLTKKKRNLKPLSMITTARRGFFDDKVFDSFESVTDEESDDFNKAIRSHAENEVDNRGRTIEPVDDSCSDSMDMTESELKCAIMMKEMGDKFVETTIDKNMIDSDDIALPCERRTVKFDEFNSIPKKKQEFIGRKKTRAMRRANKAMKDIEVEDEEEEAVIHKRIFKNMYKKQRSKLRLAFTKKGARFQAPKGKGRVKCLDTRMKHDLRIEKQKSKRR